MDLIIGGGAPTHNRHSLNVGQVLSEKEGAELSNSESALVDACKEMRG